MNDFGYIEGKDFTMEWRFVAGDFSRLPGMAADLARQVDVIIAGFTGAALAAKKATASIPIILGYAADLQARDHYGTSTKELMKCLTLAEVSCPRGDMHNTT
jgi:ABC-type uncharacterized transport system substrate-binding protein